MFSAGSECNFYAAVYLPCRCICILQLAIMSLHMHIAAGNHAAAYAYWSWQSCHCICILELAIMPLHMHIGAGNHATAYTYWSWQSCHCIYILELATCYCICILELATCYCICILELAIMPLHMHIGAGNVLRWSVSRQLALLNHTWPPVGLPTGRVTSPSNSTCRCTRRCWLCQFTVMFSITLDIQLYPADSCGIFCSLLRWIASKS